MAKSLRSKKKRRLRTLRRELAEPIYDKKEAAKLAAQEAALAAPKLAVITPASIDEEPAAVTSAAIGEPQCTCVFLPLTALANTVFQASKYDIFFCFYKFDVRDMQLCYRLAYNDMENKVIFFFFCS